jgi:hypothetical protein
MSTTQLAIFDETIHKTNIWLKEMVKLPTETGIGHIRHCVPFCCLRDRLIVD